MNIKIGDKIRELRKRNNITQEQLAEFLGVTNQAISKWESENGYPDIEYISPIADFFKVTTDYLLDHAQKGRYKILICDDKQMNRDILYDILKSEYELIITENTQNVLEYAIIEQPDLILMDIFQSESENIEIFSALKITETTCAIPVIILTRYFEHSAKYLNLGAADYIIKPFDPSELKARIKAQLRNVK